MPNGPFLDPLTGRQLRAHELAGIVENAALRSVVKEFFANAAQIVQVSPPVPGSGSRVWAEGKRTNRLSERDPQL
jgi:hypothetical protein